jgi:hypothetical protein
MSFQTISGQLGGLTLLTFPGGQVAGLAEMAH